MPNVFLSVGSDNYSAVIDYDAFRDLMDRAGDRCEHEETCEYIYEVSKKPSDGVRADRQYVFGVCHAPHLLRSLMLVSTIVNTMHLAYVDRYAKNNAEELYAISQLLSVVGMAVYRKQSFKLTIN